MERLTRRFAVCGSALFSRVGFQLQPFSESPEESPIGDSSNGPTRIGDSITPRCLPRLSTATRLLYHNHHCQQPTTSQGEKALWPREKLEQRARKLCRLRGQIGLGRVQIIEPFGLHLVGGRRFQPFKPCNLSTSFHLFNRTSNRLITHLQSIRTRTPLICPLSQVVRLWQGPCMIRVS